MLVMMGKSIVSYGDKKMKTSKENIGPDHQLFNRNFPGWTQVIVRAEKQDGWHIVAQFYGPQAKILSSIFTHSLEQVEY